MAGERMFSALPPNLQPKEKPVNENVPEALRGKTVDEAWDTIAQKAQEEWQAREDQLRREYEEKMKGSQQQPAQQPPQFTPPPPNMQQQFQQQQQQVEEPNLILEPEKYMDAQFQRRMAPLVQQQTVAMRAQNSQLFQMQNKELYDKYGQEIETFVSQLAPQLQANPQAYVVARNLVLGNHADEIAEERAKKRTAEILAQRGITFDEEPPQQPQAQPQRGFFGGTMRPPVTENPRAPAGQAGKKSVKLNETQKKMAERFGMTEEEYLEYSGMNTDQLTTMMEGLNNE